MKSSKHLRSLFWCLVAGLVVASVGNVEAARTEGDPLVSIVAAPSLADPVEHGLGKVQAALKDKGVECERMADPRRARGRYLLVVGLDQQLAATDGPEALEIRRLAHGNRQVIEVRGADARGLMYALLDIAERIGWAESARNPFREVKPTREKPYTPERALSTYTCQRQYVESFFYDEKYWARLLDMLAADRFNSFVYILGYNPSTPYSPPYPYFFDVEGFPEVRVAGLSQQDQARNLRALKRLIHMAHQRGINFTLGIWDHISRRPEYGHPVGVTRDNAIPYTKAAIARLLQLVPELDAIQFRMHWESGLSRDEKEVLAFWTSVIRMIRDTDPTIRVDCRAKGLPDSVIDAAWQMGANFRLTTKYWAEQMGLPFHPTHINRRNQHDRRHGYADLLRYPQRYKIHWKLWSAGTMKFLLWGDPEYVRRFAATTHLYNGDGYEVNAPLATKMALHPDAEPFELLKKPYQYYDYEFERYWHYFQVWGRVGYNPETPAELWQRSFAQRFGPDAGPWVMRGLHRASQVLPRTIAYAMFNFPTMSGFPEKDTGGSLPEYSKTLPSDIQLFLSMREAAELRLTGGHSARIWPWQTARWFERTAADVLHDADEAERNAGSHRTKELNSTLVDLRILANLALYHARRIPAGVYWAMYEKSNDLRYFDAALEHEQRALAAYEQVVAAADDVYADDLMFGRSRPPHWRNELAELQEDFAKLKSRRAKLPEASGPPLGDFFPIGDDLQPPVLQHQPITTARPLKPLVIKARVHDPAGVQSVRLLYRHVTQFEDYQVLEMKPTGKKNEYRATVPGSFLIPKWDFMYLFEVMDRKGNGKIYPDMEVETPYVVVELDRSGIPGAW